VDLLSRLRLMADASDPDGTITVTVAWLRSQLDAEGGDTPAPAAPSVCMDLDVSQLAALFKRGPSTIRTWFALGYFPNGYKLNDKEWRAPQADVEALQQRQREAWKRTAKGAQQSNKPAAETETLELSSWRAHYKRSA